MYKCNILEYGKGCSENHSAFKLFINYVGLLYAMGNIDASTIVKGNLIFEEFKGALTEQFVLQQLKTVPEDLSIYYWSAERAISEIDFLVQFSGKVIPLEVKAEENLRAKSLKSFHQKYSSIRSFRISMSDFRMKDWLTNIPLYAIGNFTRI